MIKIIKNVKSKIDRNVIIIFSLILILSMISSSLLISNIKNDSKSYAQTLIEEWPQLQNNAQHTGYINNTYGAPFSAKWRIDENSNPPAPPVSTRVQPIIAYGLVYIPSNDGHLYAYNANNGSLVWAYDLGSPLVNSAAVDNSNASEGIVYVGALNGKIYALIAKNPNPSQRLLWSYQTSNKIRVAPVIANGKVFIENDDGMVYALSSSSSQQINPIWSKNLQSAILDTPAYYNNVLYVGTMNLQASALDDQNNGNIIWTRQLKGQGMMNRWVTAGNGKVIFNTNPLKSFGTTQSDGTTLLSSIYNQPWTTQRNAILNYYSSSKPYNQTTYVFDADVNGAETVPPILYFGGSMSEPAAPVILPNGNFNFNYRNTEGIANPGCGTTCNDWSTYIGEYNASTNDISIVDPCNCSGPSLDNAKKIFMITDESWALIRSGNIIYVDGSRGIAGFNTNTGNTIPFVTFNSETGGYLFGSPPINFYPLGNTSTYWNSGTGWRNQYPQEEANSDGNDWKRPTPIANNGVFYILHNSVLEAIQGTDCSLNTCTNP